MFTTQPRRRNTGLNGVCHRCVVSDRGLGSQDDYSGQSQAGMTITKIANMIAPPISMIPGYNQLVNVMGNMGLNMNPMSLALASFTGGISLIPGISDVIGGLFKKATFFGDCMKWWSDANIIGMVSGVPPFPLNVEATFPEASREYQLEHADRASTSSAVKYALSPAKRKSAIAAIYLKAVRDNPMLLQLQCAVQARDKGEDTGVTMRQSEVDVYWGQLKEGSRQQELQNLVLELGKIMHPYQSMANQKMKQIVLTRDAGLVTSKAGFQLPKGIVEISKGGALVLEAGKDMSTNRVLNMTVGKPRIRNR